jgi:hypothetical protein
MRRFFSSFCRLIACVLVMSVFTSGIAMAAYVCPELTKVSMPEMMEGMPCAEMDKEQPIHCAEYQSGAEFALEHLTAAPSLAPLTILFVIPVIAPVDPVVITAFRPEVPLELGADPPYLRTQRLRI